MKTPSITRNTTVFVEDQTVLINNPSNSNKEIAMKLTDAQNNVYFSTSNQSYGDGTILNMRSSKPLTPVYGNVNNKQLLGYLVTEPQFAAATMQNIKNYFSTNKQNVISL